MHRRFVFQLSVKAVQSLVGLKSSISWFIAIFLHLALAFEGEFVLESSSGGGVEIEQIMLHCRVIETRLTLSPLAPDLWINQPQKAAL